MKILHEANVFYLNPTNCENDTTRNHRNLLRWMLKIYEEFDLEKKLTVLTFHYTGFFLLTQVGRLGLIVLFLFLKVLKKLGKFLGILPGFAERKSLDKKFWKNNSHEKTLPIKCSLLRIYGTYIPNEWLYFSISRYNKNLKKSRVSNESWKNGPRETQKRKIVGWALSIVVCV